LTETVAPSSRDGGQRFENIYQAALADREACPRVIEGRSMDSCNTVLPAFAAIGYRLGLATSKGS
jgi:hypothetical protein